MPDGVADTNTNKGGWCESAWPRLRRAHAISPHRANRDGLTSGVQWREEGARMSWRGHRPQSGRAPLSTKASTRSGAGAGASGDRDGKTPLRASTSYPGDAAQ